VALLPAIDVRRDELQARITDVRHGLSRAEVERRLGGRAFKTERRGPRTVRFWRFRITDAGGPAPTYELYKGEFEGNRLVEGMVLPHGSS
jgi:hypothetical protein